MGNVSTFMQGNARQDVCKPSSSPTAPALIQGGLVLVKDKLLCSATPTTSVCRHDGYMGSRV